NVLRCASSWASRSPMVLRTTVVVSLLVDERLNPRHQDNDRTRSHAQMLQRWVACRLLANLRVEATG
ncbi:hypothetical protein ACCT19_37975, partial [Rhizobium ruizarguesonis]